MIMLSRNKNMPSSKANLLFHPLRLQIVTALSSHEMTASDLAQAMPEVSLPTLYRHINALVQGGVLKVASETQVRGTTERTFALTARLSLGEEDLHGMKKQDYQQAFMVYLSSLMSAAQRYLNKKSEKEEFNPLADGMDLSLGTLLLTDEEFKQLNRHIVDLMLAAANNQPGAGRKPRTFSYLFIPQ